MFGIKVVLQSSVKSIFPIVSTNRVQRARNSQSMNAQFLKKLCCRVGWEADALRVSRGVESAFNLVSRAFNPPRRGRGEKGPDE